MSDFARSSLQQALGSFVVPHTGRPLGGPGAAFELERRGTVWHVTIRLGYPLAGSGEALAEALRVHSAAALQGAPLEISIESSIVAHAVQHGLKPLPGAHNLIAVASGKGGVGKSTVAVNFALALKAEGAKVGLLDADIYGPSIPMMFNVGDQRPKSAGGQNFYPIEKYGVKLISIGFFLGEKAPVIWRGPMVMGAVRQFLKDTLWGSQDYLVVDLPPGTGDAQLTLAQQVSLDGAVIVTTPQDVALLDATRAIKMFRQVHCPILGVVENMSYFICPDCGERDEIFGYGGGERMAQSEGTHLLARIPVYPEVREAGDAGMPIVIAKPAHPSSEAFMELARRVVDASAE